MNESLAKSQVNTAGWRELLSASLPWVEGLWLLVMVLAFWHHSPPIRDQWTWLVLLGLPLGLLRWQVKGYWLTMTAFVPLLLALLLLTAFNYQLAPLKRADYVVVVVRLLLSLGMVLVLVEQVRNIKSMQTALLMSLIIPSVLIGLLALTATQWNTKSGPLWSIISLLPRLDRGFLPTFSLSFNPNEIGGALAWATPWLLGLALISPRHLPTPQAAQFWRVLRTLSLVGGLLALLALGLGQSRFALLGVGLALGLLALLGLRGRARLLALSLLALLALAQLALLFNWFGAPDSSGDGAALGLNNRDQSSVVTRLEIWERGLRMLVDQPLTGMGMAMFRTAVAQPPYIIPYFQQTQQIVPHAHNEFIHIGAELGLGGLALFLGLYAACVWSLWRAWKQPIPWLRGLALALGAGMLAHAVYGLGDTISLWDRYSFLFGLLWAWCATLEIALRSGLHEQNTTRNAIIQ